MKFRLFSHYLLEDKVAQSSERVVEDENVCNGKNSDGAI